MNLTPILVALAAATATSNAALVIGDVVFNEYAADNTAANNDFFELLVITGGSDLRGLRVTDNELATGSGTFNNGEGVYVFGNDSFLGNVPSGTLITVWISGTGTAVAASGITTDTVASSAASDWSMTLTHGTGVSLGIDGLGGTVNGGLSTGGDALYLYLPGADGNSGGTDNVYLDYISYEADAAVPPTGLIDLNLPAVADNGYYTGNTAAGNDLGTNWTTYDGPNLGTPGAANPGQDLSGLQAIPEPASALLGSLGLLALLRRRR